MGVLEIENKLTDFAYFEDKNITDYSIHESVTEIGFSAFANAKNLKHIKFPCNLKKINDCAFMNTDLVDLTIPKSVKEIGIKAFSGCTKIKKVIIPEGVTSIGSSAFADCTSLEEVYLPNSLTTLEPQLFLNCKRLKKIHLPKGISYLPDEFFKGCEKLDIELPLSIKSLGQGTFNKCKNLTKYPSHVEKVSPYTFKACKKLVSVNINENITHLPDHLFDSCVNLSEIIINKPVTLGKGAFRNCVSLKDIPNNISSLGNFSFENCKGLTKIEVKTNEIPKGCFRGCVNLNEITDFDQVYSVGPYSLSNTGFKTIDLSNIRNIPSNVLSYSKNLESVLMDYALNIRSYAFYKCPKLKYTLPDYLEKVYAFAFAYNDETKEIIIPNTLKWFNPSAFYNSNIEYIKGCGNPNYKVLNSVLVVKNLNRDIVFYANGNKQEEFDIHKFDEYDNVIYPIEHIGKYAFASAKNLRKLTIPSTVTHVDVLSFADNPNLKTLEFVGVAAFPSLTTNFYKNGMVYMALDRNLEPEHIYEWPVENLIFSGDLIYIHSQMFPLLNNVKTLEFNSDKLIIGTSTFFKNDIKRIKVPEGAFEIQNNAFPKDCVIEVGGGVELKNIMLMVKDEQTYLYRLFILDDNTYLVSGHDRYVRLKKEDMFKFTKYRPDLIERKPTTFIDYFYILENYDLVDQEILRSGVLMGASKDAINTLFKYYYKDDEFFKNVLRQSGLLEQCDEYTDKILKSSDGMINFINYVELLRKYNITNPILYSRVFATDCNLEDLEIIFEHYLHLFITILKKGRIINYNPKEKDDHLRYASTPETDLVKNNNLVDYLFMLLKYNYRDSFLFNPELIGISKTKFAPKFFNKYDNNLKRLLISAGVVASKSVDLKSSIINLEDLINLIYILGGFQKNPITRQKAITFITEKMTMDLDKKNNPRKVVANDIHRMFNFSKIARNEFDSEFADFFFQYYEEIFDKEVSQSGFIERLYDNFRKISETSSSHKGTQRHLKVTMDKVINFFLINKFLGVTKKLRPLAAFLGEWYDRQEPWDHAVKIRNEMKKAPRNIFVAPIFDENEEFSHYDNNPEHDLKEDHSNRRYYYEWLPKHSNENFILGKYCSCCAHLEGAGAGIMRASIILDNVQNLVIRNEVGKIVAKSTLYINKDEGYGVFNNVEASLSIKEESGDLKEIYEAFMRGAEAFINTYNQNFKKPITELTIGHNRNRIATYLENDNHPEVKVKQAISYGDYSLRGAFGHYMGDSSTKQLLVLKRDGGNS